MMNELRTRKHELAVLFVKRTSEPSLLKDRLGSS